MQFLSLLCFLSFASVVVSQDSLGCDNPILTTYNFVHQGDFIGPPVEAADVVFFVDESGSMTTEHAWLLDVADELDKALQERRVGVLTSNRFALVTFGGQRGASLTGRVWNVGGGQFGSPSEMRAAFMNLSIAGRFEDGYSAMDVALRKLNFREDVARQFILITDENRDSVRNITYPKMLDRLLKNDVVLNVVVNHAFHLNGVQAFGMDNDSFCYEAAETAKTFVSKAGCSVVVNSGVGTTYNDYVRLAHATGGAAWNLQQLRSGGETTAAFTNAFVAVKAKEVTTRVRSCQVCNQCGGDDLTCSEFTAETQDECKVNLTTSGNEARVEFVQPACTLNGQFVKEGGQGYRYAFSRSEFGLNAPSADVVFVVDESGSMIGEHKWLQETIYLLDDALRDNGIGERSPNRYGLVGFATHGHLAGAVHVLSDNMMGNTTQFAAAIDRLLTSGQVEDGYSAISTALQKLSFRSGNVARQLILVTDEDRDPMLSLSRGDVKKLLEEMDFRINTVVNHNIEDKEGNPVLGIDGQKRGYIVGDTTSGYTTMPKAVLPSDGGHGSTLKDYVMLALDSAGAAWDLNQLRRGGAIARAFTNSFVDTKRREITEQLKVCETCKCTDGELVCERREGATSADQCFAAARCRVGRRYIEEQEYTASYSITDEMGTNPMADILVVVDESRSMIGEHRWLRKVIPDLDTALRARGVGKGVDSPNLFGLVGYASNGDGRKDNMGTVLMFDETDHRMMGTADEFKKLAMNKLKQVGRLEDGYSAIMRALNAHTFRDGAAKLVILVTDEDRDVLNSSLTFDVVYDALASQDIVLNAVINQGFAARGRSALGIDGTSERRAYFPRRTTADDGTRKVTFKAKKGGEPVHDSGYGTTGDDYAKLALKTSGGAWDLNKLREGGKTAKAFTLAFVAVKVKEVVTQLKQCRVCQCLGSDKFQCGIVKNVSRAECSNWTPRRREPLPGDEAGRFFFEGVAEDVTPLIEIVPSQISVCSGDGFSAHCYGRLYNGESSLVVDWMDVPANGMVTSNANRTDSELDVSKANELRSEYRCQVTTNTYQSTGSLIVDVTDNAECQKNCVTMYGDGYAMILRGRMAKIPFEISFKFCPSTVTSGTLYCLENSSEGCSQCLVLNDGDLELQWNCCLQGGQPLRYSSHDSLALSPKECYNTVVTITETQVSLKVDTVEITAPLAPQCADDFQPSQNLFIGGTIATAVDENGYNGCMTEVVCDRKPVLFHDVPTPSPAMRVKRPKMIRRVRRCTKACDGGV